MFNSHSLKAYAERGKELIIRYHKQQKYIKILTDLDRKHKLVTTYIVDHRCPRTTNLIEGYNSHLAQRLKSIHGFESYGSANLWLNAFTLYKRITPFTDCKGIFKDMNSHAPLFYTVEDDGPRRKILKYFGVDFRF